MNIKEEDKKIGFWNIIKKYNLDDLDIFNEINKPYLFDNINSVFKYFIKSDIFCIKYVLKRHCTKCNYYLEINEHFNPYISINLEDLNIYRNLSLKIKDLLYIDDSSCQRCCVNLVKNKLLDEFSSKCFKTKTENIILPKILIFSFDLEETSNLIVDYDILKNNQNKIISKLDYNIIIENNNYHLSAIIQMPNYNHYSCSIIDSFYKTIYVDKSNNYYNDAKENDSEIKKENFEEKKLTDFLKLYPIVSAIYIMK